MDILPNIKPGETLPFYGDAHKKTPQQWKREVKKADKAWNEKMKIETVKVNG